MGAKLKLVAPTAALTGDAETARYEIARIRSLARVWINATPEAQRRDVSALFVRRAFDRLGDLIEPDAKLNASLATPYGKLDSTARAMADSLGEAAAALPLSEAAFSLSSLYTVLLSAHDRGVLGAFYTPPGLVGRLVALAEEAGVDWAKVRVLDPAAGGGAFLMPVAEKMLAALKTSEPRAVLGQIERRLKGLELDPHAAGFAQTALDQLLSPLSRAAGRPAPRVVEVADTLERAPQAEYDLVIGNPPYGRIRLTPEQRQRYARSLYGHANLYGVFTDIALRWTKPKGVVAYLTPTSVLGGQYFAALRRLLAEDAPPEAIDFVHSRKGVFEDALQETMLAVFRKGAKPGAAQVHYVTLESEREAAVIRNGTIALPATRDAPWLAPRSPDQSILAAAASRMTARLSDWGYKVSTGRLVWNRFKDQLCARGGRNRYPLIWAEAVSADGRFGFRAEKRNHLPWFEARGGDQWLLTRDSCVLVQRTTSKEQERRLIAAELPATFLKTHKAVVVENHLNMVRPVGRPKVSPAVLATVLNSMVVDQVFRCISGSVAVSAFELEAVPLPTAEEMKALAPLAEEGADRSVFEAALRTLYLGVEA